MPDTNSQAPTCDTRRVVIDLSQPGRSNGSCGDRLFTSGNELTTRRFNPHTTDSDSLDANATFPLMLSPSKHVPEVRAST